MTDMADTKAQENVLAVDDKVRALETAKWNALKSTVGNTPVDWQPVQQAVIDAEKNILQGSPENIALFRNIMKEGGGQAGLADASVFRGRQGVDVKEFLSSIKDPAQRDRFIADMRAKGEDVSPDQSGIAKEGAEVPFDTARGFYTEFGQKMASGLPSDVRRALGTVQGAVDSQIMKAVAKAGGKSAVLEYKTLKNNWRDYMQTFYDKDSPVRKLKEGKDPNDKLNPITGDEGERAIGLLGKYRSLGADVQSLGKIRALQSRFVSCRAVGRRCLPTWRSRPCRKPQRRRLLHWNRLRRQKLEGAAKSYCASTRQSLGTDVPAHCTATD